MKIQEAVHIANLSDRYSRCIKVSKRVRWDIDDDVIRNRKFNNLDKFLPDSLSRLNQLEFLKPPDLIFLSQIQGRTYANIFGLVERFINAKVLELTKHHFFGDQTALEALVRFSDEELKHQELFRRIETMTARGMPRGYSFVAKPNEFGREVLKKSAWAVLALTCHIELFTQSHYKQSIKPEENLSDLYKDVFLYHWKEESQHAILDELEWRSEDNRLSNQGRDKAIDDLITLVLAIDEILQKQSVADANYFIPRSRQTLYLSEQQRIRDLLLEAYRWQYIASGIVGTRFIEILGELTSAAQMKRVYEALNPLMQ